MSDTPCPAPSPEVLERVSPGLERQLRHMAEQCKGCGKCAKVCTFLATYGTPRDIALRYDPRNPENLIMPFGCHLCGLCGVMGPSNIRPERMFLEMRREAVSRWQGDFPQHARMLAYEARGASPRYSLCALPENCETVLFPGCTLPGIKPATFLKLWHWLQQHAPDVGVVLDCCAKPSHDLGRQRAFQDRFLPLRDMLLQHGVRTVLTTCPSCFKVFQEYGAPLAPRMVYEYLAEEWTPEEGQPRLQGEVAVHDPCPLRHYDQTHDALRTLVRRTGLQCKPMLHERKHTVCCGEGGAVSHMVPEFARAWTDMRAQEADGAPIVSSCAGCVLMLGQMAPTHHVLDLLFFPQRAMAGRTKTSRPPLTYFNRLRLRARLRKQPGFARFPLKRLPQE